jgi:lipopolysaccharide export system permease protein
MGLYYYLIPTTHSLLRSMFFNEVEESIYAVLRRDQKINEPRLSYAMWVRQVQGRKLIDAIFKRRGPDGKSYDLVARAREADLRVDLTRKLLLLHMRNGTVQIEGGTTGYLDDKIWELELPTSYLGDRQRRPRELTWREIGARRKEVLQLEESLRAEIALTEGKIASNGVPQELPQHLQNLKEKLHYIHFEVLALDAERQMRPALAFGCLCFVLVGCPVGIWFSRSDYLSAFISCFLPIVVLYYPLMLCGTNMAKDGKLPAAAGIWAANAILVLIGLVMYRRLLRN